MVLLQTLRVIEGEEHISKEAIDYYLKLFDKPLAPHHIKVVADLFDPEGAEFDEPNQFGFGAFNFLECVEPCAA